MNNCGKWQIPCLCFVLIYTILLTGIFVRYKWPDYRDLLFLTQCIAAGNSVPQK